MPKLWLMIFFGYNGSSFHGMQFQREEHVSTVEDMLVDKLHTGGFLVTNHHTQLQKQEKWSRAARTDKGVHAVLNAVSCMFTIDKNYFDEEKILNHNKLLLDLKQLFEGTEIIFHAFKRVNMRCEVRYMVKSRHYCYICPKLLFLQASKKLRKEDVPQQKNENAEQIDKSNKIQSQVGSLKVSDIINHLNQPQNNNELSDEQLLDKIRVCCAQFVGTHNFHNYSKNLRAKDAQAQRYIINFNVQKLDDNNLIFNIIGQSFIYHQIRKMIGCIIMTFINNYPPTYIPNTFFRNQINMPLAPAQGLYLNSLSFDNYNKKKDIPESLDVEGVASIEELKNSINQYILAQDEKEWIEWITKLRQSIYHGIEYVEEQQKEPNTGKEVQQE